MTILGKLCPFYLCVNMDGMITQAGLGIQRVVNDDRLAQGAFFEFFELIKPVNTSDLQTLLSLGETNLTIRVLGRSGPPMKGTLFRNPKTSEMVLNFSFGIHLRPAVEAYNLSFSDFAPTDLAVEMLYLLEAQSVIQNLSRDLTLRLQSEKHVAELDAQTDALTGLKNRRGLEPILNNMFEREKKFSVLQVDLDFFKAVNDNFGHAAGDYVLQHAAHVLTEEVRSSDTVAQLGDDEFFIVLQNALNVSTLEQIAARIISRLEQPMEYQGHICKISASIGIAYSDDGGCIRDGQTLLKNADEALYASKENGKAQYQFYADIM